MRKLLVCGLAFLVVLCIGPPAKAVTTTFFDFTGDGVADTSVTIPTLGGTFNARVFIAPDAAVTGLVSAGVTLMFDPVKLDALSATFASPPWLFNQVVAPNVPIDNTAGRANLGGGNIIAQTGTLLIGTASFRVDAEGTSTLSMTELFPANLTYDSTVTGGELGVVLDKVITYGSASIIGPTPIEPPTPGVPEPMTLALLAGGLLAMIPLKRKLKGH